MFRMVENNRGMTLIEILCSLSLLIIVLLLVNSIHLFGLQQMNDQTSDFNGQSNVRQAINLITKEIRSANAVNVSSDVLTIDNKDIYKLDNHTLTKNGQSIITGLQDFSIAKNGSKVSISLAGIPSQGGKQITLTDTIYIRE